MPSFVLSLLLVECVTEPVQLAKQAKPNLTAVACCCVNWLWKAAAKAAAGNKEDRRRKEWSHFSCGSEWLPLQLC